MDEGSQSKSKKVKKKKLKSKKQSQNIKIIDTQADYKTFNSDDNDNHEFDLMEEKPLMYAKDGATIFTKEFEEQEKKKMTSWKSLGTEKEKRKIEQHSNSESDYSPPRARPSARRKRHDSDSDMSPDRIGGDEKSSTETAVKNMKRARHDSSGSDFSPERPIKQESDSDFSPDRGGGDSQKDKQKRKEAKPEVVSTGKKSGLQSASELRVENERRRLAEKEKFENLDKDISGRGADTIIRDRKSGKKVDIKLEAIKRRKKEEEHARETEKQAVWGRGMAQQKEYEQRLEDALHEVDKPLARYKDDKDLDQLLKAKDREGDPMAAYMAKKKEKSIGGGKPNKPRYKGPTPTPNRFNIWPGYRYDGVDRSNGFEKKRFASINNMKTFNNEKYKWSVEDMQYQKKIINYILQHYIKNVNGKYQET